MKFFKNTLTLCCAILLVANVWAQNPGTAKLHLDNGDIDKAKNAIDKALENPKHTEKAKTWLYRAMIYRSISNDEKMRSKTPDAAYVSYESIKKCLEIEPDNSEAKKEYETQTYNALINAAIVASQEAGKNTKNEKTTDAEKNHREVVKYTKCLLC